MAATVLLQ